MKVFISWSGRTSHDIAVKLRDWLPNVIQTLEIYVSSEDIEKGARWLQDISGELADTNYGILCVTRDNISAPWLNFEAGALSKSVDKSNVAPFLFDLDRSDVKGPITQFQSTIFEFEDVRKLLQSLNAADSESSLERSRLDRIFERWWPDLEEQLSRLARTESPTERSQPRLDARDKLTSMLEEVLELTRQQSRVLATQERSVAALGASASVKISAIAVLELIEAWTELVNSIAPIKMTPEEFNRVDQKIRAGRKLIDLLRRPPDRPANLSMQRVGQPTSTRQEDQKLDDWPG